MNLERAKFQFDKWTSCWQGQDRTLWKCLGDLPTVSPHDDKCRHRPDIIIIPKGKRKSELTSWCDCDAVWGINSLWYLGNMSLTQHISCFTWSKQFPPSHSLPLKSSRVPETKDWLLMREGSEVLLELTNYFRALSGHHCFSTKQISLSIWCCKCGVWTLVFSKWQHRYIMLVFCLTDDTVI